MNKHHLFTVAIACLSLTACVGSLKPSMMEDTTLSPRKIELVEQRHIQKLGGRDVTPAQLNALKQDYIRYGDSPVYVVFGYDPAGSTLDERAAKNRAALVKGQLGKMNIPAVVKALPVKNSDGQAVIAYDRLTARGPQNCGQMPGLNGVQTGEYTDYGMGCTVKDMMAKQVARPRDLEGRGGLGNKADGVGRYAAAVARDVNAGEINEFVPSYVLAELASSTSQ